MILFNNTLITVLSERDGGKTSFSTLLQNNLDSQIKSIALTVEPPCNIDSLINDIATRLHLHNDAQTNFSSIVAQVNERKAHVLLIIDDAQHLPESFIKEAMLAIKKQEDFGYFHLCLVSDYSVVATLNSLAVEQLANLVHTIELGSLNESETRTYVLQRAMTAGLITRPLSDAQFKQFFQLTKGNLAKINANLEIFILNCSPHENRKKSLMVKKTSVAIAAAAAVAGSVYLYIENFYLKESIASEIAAINIVPKEQVVEQITVQPAYAAVQINSYIASWQDSSIVQLVHNELPKKQILDGLDDPEQMPNTIGVVDKVVVIPTVKVKEQAIKVVTEIHNKKPLAESKPAYTESNLSYIAKSPLNKPSTNGYTIQLAASHNIGDVQRFQKNNHLAEQTKIRHFTNAKGSWYILTIGDYDSRNQAQVKVKNLPAKLAKLKPWVRPVSNLSDVG